MSGIDRKARIREYKESPPPAGIFRVRNVASSTSLIGQTANLPGMLNRLRFQLEMGSHPDKDLQADWNSSGEGAFEFSVLDTLEPSDDPAADLSADLAVLHEEWLERLAESGERFYPGARRGLK
jgi:hypothetical protein